MSSQMSLPSARVIDPVLSSLALGYKNPEFVGRFLFPRVPVTLSGGKVIVFGKEQFMAYSTLRAPGSTVKRLQIAYGSQSWALENHALDGVIPRELQRDANVMPGINFQTRTVNTTMRSLELELEVQQAALATSSANYDGSHQVALSGTAKFSNAASNPIQAIDSYRENIRATCGLYPNTIVFSAVAWNAFRDNPNVLGRIVYTQKGVITEDIAAGLLNIPNVIVGKSVASDVNGNFSDVWGNNIVLGFTDIGALNGDGDASVPSFGYTYTMDGQPLVEVPYWDQSSRSWVIGVTYERVPVISGIASGFLIQTPA